jgi:hypothetical protein
MALAASLGGCAAEQWTPDGSPSLVEADRQVEEFAIKNATGRPIYGVLLEEVAPPAGQAPRIGEVSPIPENAIQTFLRSASKPPLPRALLVTWREPGGTVQTRQLDLTVQPLGDGDVLLVEILGQGRVVVGCVRRAELR